jgi:hypothetical protein
MRQYDIISTNNKDNQFLSNSLQLTVVLKTQRRVKMKIASITNNSSNFYNSIQKTSEKQKDDVSESIQKQIDDLKAQITSISENKDMSVEGKMEKKKELQSMIDELNNQLTQRKIEVQKQNQEEKSEAIDNSNLNKQQTLNTNQVASSMDEASMKSLIGAGIAMSRVNKAESVKTNMKGEAGVLSEEIKLDSARGRDTSNKRSQLSKIKGNISSISVNNASRLSDVNKEMEETKGKKSEKEADKIENSNDPTKTKKAKGILIKGEADEKTMVEENDKIPTVIDNVFVPYDSMDLIV